MLFCIWVFRSLRCASEARPLQPRAGQMRALFFASCLAAVWFVLSLKLVTLKIAY